MTVNTSHARARADAESGVALIWAIIVMIIILGLLVVISVATLSNSRETRESASRARAVFWAESAGKDLVARIDNAELGPWEASRDSVGNRTLRFLSAGSPVNAQVPGSTSFPITAGSADRRALPLTSSAGGQTQNGWYQILPPKPGLPAWTGIKIMDPANPGAQGSVQFVIRAWHDAVGAQPALIRVELRRNALSRFSLLSEDRLTLGGIGSLNLGGAIHTNNTRGASNGIDVGAATSMTGVRSVTTTTGSITGSCGGVCKPNVREVVSFGSAARAMRHVERIATIAGRCNASGFGACALAWAGGTPAVDQLGAWHVNLDAAGGCVAIGRLTFPTRTDTGAYPMLDDRRGPLANPVAVQNYCPATGGGAIVLDGDVVVSGLRPAGSPSVTIMARRTAAYPSARVNSSAAYVPVTAPASIYLEQSANGAGIGATSANDPVGLVAQGGIYLPSWAMSGSAGGARSGRNDTLAVRNVAAMAVSGEIAYSPSIQAIAADGSAPGGLGLNATDARAAGYGFGTNFTFDGSLVSGGRMVFRYGQAASFIGYGTRSISYVESLAWNPPPWFPADSDWHVADWTEFDE